jgi:hypothetical protein
VIAKTNKLVDYNHDQNIHTLEGSLAALSFLFRNRIPASLLDVGCGRGTWVRGAMDLGVANVEGLDGADIPYKELLFPQERFRKQNLTSSWNLERKFDMVLCLEGAENIDASFSELLVRNLTMHGDEVIFAAACPGQGGQHHVNCQWPIYWQSLFNMNGFVCNDTVRWQIWDISTIEPWYRQNMFIARRDSMKAGSESRMRSVVHPELARFMYLAEHELEWRKKAEAGRLPGYWYPRAVCKALWSKILRRYRKMSISKQGQPRTRETRYLGASA